MNCATIRRGSRLRDAKPRKNFTAELSAGKEWILCSWIVENAAINYGMTYQLEYLGSVATLYIST